MCLLLTVSVLASCSRIVSADYPLLDKGTVQSVDRVHCKISIASDRDSVCRVWQPETYMDGLSAWGFRYTDSIASGDECYVYDGGEKPIVSKISIADAKKINTALCSWFNRYCIPSPQAPLLVLLAVFTLFFCRRAFKEERLACFFVLLTTSVLVSFLFCPGRVLLVEDKGTVTAVEKNRYILDGNRIYFASAGQDIFNGGELSEGTAVTVYSYGDEHETMSENVFLSRSSFGDALLKMPQVYPEIMLRSLGLYWMFLLIFAVILYLIAFRVKQRTAEEKHS